MRRASRRRLAGNVPGSASTSPRRTSEWSSPLRLTAVRLPGRASSTGRLCCCRPRMRTRRPVGSRASSAPCWSAPPTRVPVTTVPNPDMANERSTGNRGRPMSGRGAVFSSSASSAVRSSSRPAPVLLDTATIGAWRNELPATSAVTSSRTNPSQAWSTRSALLSTTTPCSMPSRSMIARCSRVCGIGPSSAAITSRTASIP